MKRGGSFLLLLVMVLLGGVTRTLDGSACAAPAGVKALDRLQNQISQLRKALDETMARLDRLQRMYGLERYCVPTAIELFGQTVPLERRDVWERLDREFLISVHDVPQVLLWIKRANRYFPMIQERLKARGLPDDLKFVTIVESGLRPEARSYAGAVGLWQFMAGTGSKYRLRRTSWVDERRDPIKSTGAALDYLTNLHGVYGDWFLAVAAYNVGEDRIDEELKRQRVTSYFDLVLPLETERYIFRIASAKAILQSPETYGFELPSEELYHPLMVEPTTVQIEKGEMELLALAEACGMTYRAFKELNPHFRRGSIPRGRYAVYLPPEKVQVAELFIGQWNRKHKRSNTASSGSSKRITHRVRPGETLSEIALKYRVRLKALKEWNHLDNANLIYAGQRLHIFR